MILIYYKPIDIIAGKNNPIKIDLYLYSNETQTVSIDTPSLEWIANLPQFITIQKDRIIELTIVAYPKGEVDYFPLTVGINTFLIPVVYKEENKIVIPKETKEEKPKVYNKNVTIKVNLIDKKELKLCVEGKIEKPITYKVWIDDNLKSGKIEFPFCLVYDLPQNPGLHTIKIKIEGLPKEYYKELEYYIPPYFYYLVFYNISTSLFGVDVKITVKTFGNIPGKVSFCVPVNPKFCINEIDPPNITREFELKFSYTPYYLTGALIGLSIMGLAYLYFSKKVRVKKEYKIKGNKILVTLIISNLTKRKVRGIIIDKIPPGAIEIKPLTEGVKVKEFAGEKFVVYYYELEPLEEIVISYEIEFPFEPLNVKLPNPIVR